LNAHEVRSAYDRQVRRRICPDQPGERVERGPSVVRVLGDDGWRAVLWSDLDAATADQVITEQLDRFSGLGAWEWKLHSYDQPRDLPQRLAAAGLAAGQPETLMVAELDALAPGARAADGVLLVPVVDDGGVDGLVGLHDEVFGGDHSAVGRALLAQLRATPPTAAAVLAVADGVPVSGGRVELARGTDFASIWGGGTLPAWRGQGLFRAVVASRAALAAAEGFRFLQVDATAASRPILARMGFVELATTIPYVHPGG
jgi:GNAT superfamily N-acetyltransferase